MILLLVRPKLLAGATTLGAAAREPMEMDTTAALLSEDVMK